MQRPTQKGLGLSSRIVFYGTAPIITVACGGELMDQDREVRTALAQEHLRLLPNVVTARIIETADGDEIHVMVNQRLDQEGIKRLKKDIETIYVLDTGERVDYRKVSIAQVQQAQPGDITGVVGRPVLASVGLEYGPKGSMCARVVLEHSGHSFEGNATGRAGEDEVCEMVKDATVDAIQLMTGDALRLQAACEFLGDKVVAEVIVVNACSGKKQRYVGAAFHKDDLPTSVARSLLHALNRQFEMVLKPLIST